MVPGGAAGGVGQQAVGIGQGAELPRGCRVAGPGVGVHRAGEPPVGAGDVRAGGVWADAQHLVGVPLAHPASPALAPIRPADYLSMHED